MATRLESLLSKVAGWTKRSARRNGHAQLPKNVRAYLEKEFHLHPEDMEVLQCVGRKGSFEGSPAKFVRILDRVRAREQGIAINGYGDLGRHSDLVLFKGHISKDGTVHLSDRRKNV